MNIKRGELYYADLSPVVGSEQGSRPRRAERRRKQIFTDRYSGGSDQQNK